MSAHEPVFVRYTGTAVQACKSEASADPLDAEKQT